MQVAELRKRTNGLPDDYLVTLVGDMITEEGLPTYMTMLNTLDGVRDDTGASSSPWAQWTRKWTAEENRHGARAPPQPHTRVHTQLREHPRDGAYVKGVGVSGGSVLGRVVGCRPSAMPWPYECLAEAYSRLRSRGSGVLWTRLHPTTAHGWSAAVYR